MSIRSSHNIKYALTLQTNNLKFELHVTLIGRSRFHKFTKYETCQTPKANKQIQKPKKHKNLYYSWTCV